MAHSGDTTCINHSAIRGLIYRLQFRLASVLTHTILRLNNVNLYIILESYTNKIQNSRSLYKVIRPLPIVEPTKGVCATSDIVCRSI